MNAAPLCRENIPVKLGIFPKHHPLKNHQIPHTTLNHTCLPSRKQQLNKNITKKNFFTGKTNKKSTPTSHTKKKKTTNFTNKKQPQKIKKKQKT